MRSDTNGPQMKIYGQLYYLPFYFTSVKGQGLTITGVFIMDVNIILFPASVTAGIFMSRRGTFVWAIQVGFAILALGDGLLLYFDQYNNLATHLMIALVSGIGIGFVLPSLETATQAIAEPENLTHAVSTYIFMRMFGLCIGVASGGAVFSNVFLQALEERGVPGSREIAQNSEIIAESLKDMPRGISQRHASILLQG